MGLLSNPSSCSQLTVRPSKQKISEFGAERGLFEQGQTRRMGSSCLKELNSLLLLRENILKANFWVKALGYISSFLLVWGKVTGWCFRNLSRQPGSNQSSVCMFVLSLKLPSLAEWEP